jgi:hypothetical protein
MFAKARLDTLGDGIFDVATMLAIARSFIHPRVALSALALNFAALQIRKSRRATVLD